MRSGSTVDRDGRRERATRAMGDAAEVEDARVALTLIDASRYEPVTFAPWEDCLLYTSPSPRDRG